MSFWKVRSLYKSTRAIKILETQAICVFLIGIHSTKKNKIIM